MCTTLPNIMGYNCNVGLSLKLRIMSNNILGYMLVDF